MPKEQMGVSDEASKVTRHFDLPVETNQRLKEISAKTKKSNVAIVRDAIESYNESKKENLKETLLDVMRETGLLEMGLRHAEIDQRKPTHVLLHRLATAPCGAWMDAVVASEPFVLSADVAAVLGAEEGDVVIMADGESMVGAGIKDGSTLIMRFLGDRLPKSGEICLVQAKLDNGECVGSVKTWRWDTEGFYLEDGDAVEFGFPEGTIEVHAVARKVAMLCKG